MESKEIGERKGYFMYTKWQQGKVLDETVSEKVHFYKSDKESRVMPELYPCIKMISFGQSKRNLQVV